MSGVKRVVRTQSRAGAVIVSTSFPLFVSAFNFIAWNLNRMQQVHSSLIVHGHQTGRQGPKRRSSLKVIPCISTLLSTRCRRLIRDPTLCYTVVHFLGAFRQPSNPRPHAKEIDDCRDFGICEHLPPRFNDRHYLSGPIFTTMLMTHSTLCAASTSLA